MEPTRCTLTRALCQPSAAPLSAPPPEPRWPASRWRARLLAAALLFAGGAVTGSVLAGSPSTPPQIPYRGVLKKNGVPYTGSAKMTFSIYNGLSSQATTLYSEERVVAVSQGLFSVALGEGDGVKFADVFNQTNAEQLYLGVNVEGTDLEQRQRILSVPFARRTQVVIP